MIDTMRLATALLFVEAIPYLTAAGAVLMILVWGWWVLREVRRAKVNAVEANSTARALGERVQRLEELSRITEIRIAKRCELTTEATNAAGLPCIVRCGKRIGHEGPHVSMGGSDLAAPTNFGCRIDEVKFSVEGPRCNATTMMPNTLPGPDEAPVTLWCGLPANHEGRHIANGQEFGQ